MWSGTPHLHLIKWLQSEALVDSQLDWHAIGKNPVLLQSLIHFVRGCCEHHQFVPKTLYALPDTQPLAFAFAALSALPIVSEPQAGQTLILCCYKSDIQVPIHANNLGISILD